MTRNPRRTALTVLRNMKHNVNAMVTRWNQAQTVHERTGSRPRLDAEKIENNTEEWRNLIRFMDAVIHDAGVMRTYALQQIESREN